MKLASLSFATALASIVFPVPGGPYNNTPAGGVIPILTNASGSLIGHSTVSLSSCIISPKPPISLKLIFGISTMTSLNADG